MKLVIIFLNKVEHLEDLISAFLEIGIPGATILDSVGMGRIITKNIPIFAGLRETFAGSSPSNKTILTLVEEEMIKKIDGVLKDIFGDYNEPGTVSMLSVPVEKMFGFGKD